jgi:hypothetical protein
MLARKPKMLVTVALANKMARTIWALLVKGGVYRAPIIEAQIADNLAAGFADLPRVTHLWGEFARGLYRPVAFLSGPFCQLIVS